MPVYKKDYGRYETLIVGGSPISTDEVKEYLRIIGNEEDQLIDTLTSASIKTIENYTGFNIQYKTRQAKFYNFDNNSAGFWCNNTILDIYDGNIKSITSVQYYDTNKQLQILPTSSYIATIGKCKGQLSFCIDGVNQKPNIFSCGIIPVADSVIVDYVCGFNELVVNPRDDLPPQNITSDTKVAICMLVANMYNNRGDTCSDTLPPTIVNLIAGINCYVL